MKDNKFFGDENRPPGPMPDGWMENRPHPFPYMAFILRAIGWAPAVEGLDPPVIWLPGEHERVEAAGDIVRREEWRE